MHALDRYLPLASPGGPTADPSNATSATSIKRRRKLAESSRTGAISDVLSYIEENGFEARDIAGLQRRKMEAEAMIQQRQAAQLEGAAWFVDSALPQIGLIVAAVTEFGFDHGAFPADAHPEVAALSAAEGKELSSLTAKMLCNAAAQQMFRAFSGAYADNLFGTRGQAILNAARGAVEAVAD